MKTYFSSITAIICLFFIISILSAAHTSASSASDAPTPVDISLSKWFESDSVAKLLNMQRLEQIELSTPLNVFLLGFDGDGNHQVRLSDDMISTWFKPSSSPTPHTILSSNKRLSGSDSVGVAYKHQYNVVKLAPQVVSVIEIVLAARTRPEPIISSSPFAPPSPYASSTLYQMDPRDMELVLTSLVRFLNVQDQFSMFIINPQRPEFIDAVENGRDKHSKYGYRYGLSDLELDLLTKKFTSVDDLYSILFDGKESSSSPFFNYLQASSSSTDLQAHNVIMSEWMAMGLTQKSKYWADLYLTEFEKSEKLVESYQFPEIIFEEELDEEEGEPATPLVVPDAWQKQVEKRALRVFALYHVDRSCNPLYAAGSSASKKEQKACLLEAMQKHSHETCLVDNWMSSKKYVTVDVSAGPFTWGPIVGGDGVRTFYSSSIPTMSEFERYKQLSTSSATSSASSNTAYNSDTENIFSAPLSPKAMRELTNEADMLRAMIERQCTQEVLDKALFRSRVEESCNDFKQRLALFDTFFNGGSGTNLSTEQLNSLALIAEQHQRTSARFQRRKAKQAAMMERSKDQKLKEQEEREQEEKERSEYMAQSWLASHLSALVSSTANQLLSPPTAPLPSAFGGKNIHIKFFVISNHRNYDPLSPGYFDLDHFQSQIKKLLAPSSSSSSGSNVNNNKVSFTTTGLSLGSDPALSVAFTRSLHVRVNPTLTATGRLQVRKEMYLDAAAFMDNVQTVKDRTSDDGSSEEKKSKKEKKNKKDKKEKKKKDKKEKKDKKDDSTLEVTMFLMSFDYPHAVLIQSPLHQRQQEQHAPASEEDHEALEVTNLNVDKQFVSSEADDPENTSGFDFEWNYDGLAHVLMRRKNQKSSLKSFHSLLSSRVDDLEEEEDSYEDEEDSGEQETVLFIAQNRDMDFASEYMCNGHEVELDLRNPLRQALAGALTALTGQLPPHVTTASNGDGNHHSQDWLWSSGSDPSAITSKQVSYSEWTIDVAQRNAMLVSSLSHALQRLDASHHLLSNLAPTSSNYDSIIANNGKNQKQFQKIATAYSASNQALSQATSSSSSSSSASSQQLVEQSRQLYKSSKALISSWPSSLDSNSQCIPLSTKAKDLKTALGLDFIFITSSLLVIVALVLAFRKEDDPIPQMLPGLIHRWI